MGWPIYFLTYWDDAGTVPACNRMLEYMGCHMFHSLFRSLLVVLHVCGFCFNVNGTTECYINRT